MFETLERRASQLVPFPIPELSPQRSDYSVPGAGHGLHLNGNAGKDGEVVGGLTPCRTPSRNRATGRSERHCGVSSAQLCSGRN